METAAAKDHLWHVEANGKSAAAPFLDQALERVLPHLSSRQRDALMIKLLTMAYTWRARD